jgi:non-heme chloroperoxidase
MTMIKTRNGTGLYVKKWGAGRPVIMMHGWPLSADTFDDMAIAIADAGMQAISYDRRGFGRSDQPWNGYDYDTLADDLADVMIACDAQNAALIGFSMGGGEVARYMSRHGGKGVTQAVLIASIVPYMLKTGDNPNGVDPAIFEDMAAQMRSDRAAFFTSFFADFYGVGILSSPVSQEVLDWSASVAMLASLKATLACANAFATTDFRADTAAFNCPTLIIHGTADKTVPIDTSARQAARLIPGAQMIEYDGAPHGLFATHKEQLAEDVLAFLHRG